MLVSHRCLLTALSRFKFYLNNEISSPLSCAISVHYRFIPITILELKNTLENILEEGKGQLFVLNK
ncbi:hypothetical protein A9Q85_00645 [Cycloclasticus sp. 44_32_T64]|nr:hypothetical protein A9Q85_00645 [Cycloclasticus sp. 44_32_T64]